MLNLNIEFNVPTMIGSLGVILSTSGFIFQIVQMIRTRSADDLNFLLFFLTCSQAIVWATYYGLIDNLMGVIENCFCILSCIIILILKIYYHYEKKKVLICRS